jgi:hypothetical protein
VKGLEAVVAVTAAAIGAAVRPVSCCFDVSQYYTCTTLLQTLLEYCSLKLMNFNFNRMKLYCGLFKP